MSRVQVAYCKTEMGLKYCWQADLGRLLEVLEVTVWTAGYGGAHCGRRLELSSTGAFAGNPAVHGSGDLAAGLAV